MDVYLNRTIVPTVKPDINVHLDKEISGQTPISNDFKEFFLVISLIMICIGTIGIQIL